MRRNPGEEDLYKILHEPVQNNYALCSANVCLKGLAAVWQHLMALC